MTSPVDYPAITTTPRYLTGDKAGLKEFLDKFDVRLLCSIAMAEMYSVSSKSSNC